ncbi:MAG: hypothetical protein N3G80_02215 [Candidatus Micrarchaeota archaeon]|nr:hypothetical protein [Candidatus Micrarchaeota archaeon]
MQPHANAKAQASAEIIAVLGIMLLAVLTFTVLSSNLLFDFGSQKEQQTARQTVQALAKAADEVYSQGKGASTIVQITIPPSANLSIEKSFIGKPPSASSEIFPNTINLHVAGTDIYENTLAPLAGSFPLLPGEHQVKVSSHGTFVSIGSSLVEVSPPAVFHYGKKGQVSSYKLRLVPSVPDNLHFELNLIKSYPHLPLTVFPSSFSTSGASVDVTLYFQPSALAGGTYQWDLLINTTVASPSCFPNCQNDFLIVPIVFEVRG